MPRKTSRTTNRSKIRSGIHQRGRSITTRAAGKKKKSYQQRAKEQRWLTVNQPRASESSGLLAETKRWDSGEPSTWSQAQADAQMRQNRRRSEKKARLSPLSFAGRLKTEIHPGSPGGRGVEGARDKGWSYLGQPGTYSTRRGHFASAGQRKKKAMQEATYEGTVAAYKRASGNIKTKRKKRFKAHEEQGWGYTLPKSPHH